MPIRETLTRYWQPKGRWKYGILALIALAIFTGIGLILDIPGVRHCVTSANLEQCQFLGKTSWEWLGLLGVPFSLAILGYILQRQQQQRSEALAKEQREIAEALAKEQREIAAGEEKEEILQTYFDRLSTLLIDKNLLAIAAKVYPQSKEGADTQSQSVVSLEERELFDAAVDVTRARTLSILRRFADDSERKSSVIQFLIEAEVIGKAKINLSGANLSGANLSDANLTYANLSGANLSGANLSGANLSGAQLSDANLSDTHLVNARLSDANLSGAQLTDANLIGAQLIGAYLEGANLEGAHLFKANLRAANLRAAYLSGANLEGADLSGAQLIGAYLEGVQKLTNEQLTQAKLCRTILPKSITLDPNRDC